MSDKEILLARSALSRRQLRRDAKGLRDSLQWRPVAIAAANAPAVRQIAFGLALSLFGFRRAARVVMLAGRIVVFTKLARSVITLASKPGKAPPAGRVRYRTD